MSVKLNESYIGRFVSEKDMAEIRGEIERSLQTVKEGTGAGNGYLGWRDLPLNYRTEEYNRIKTAAEKIRRSCDVFVVIGIGGSYLGARAAIEFIKSPKFNELPGTSPKIYFSGNDISAASLSELISICDGKDICVNVISKSGKTTEPAVSFRIFRELLEKKYGEEGARERIFVTTDAHKGALKTLADDKGYESFVVPGNIGGRYSVLTSVGLLPIAVAGCDIDAILSGAVKARKDLIDAPFDVNPCLRYAAIRNIMYRTGKKVEILAAYDGALAMLNEWWKQLYGESEGKEGKGLIPDSVIYTTDLHSLGQMVQEGASDENFNRIFFETVFDVKNARSDISVPFDKDDLDELNYIGGRTLHEINATALKATALAHSDGNVPNLIVELDSRDEKTFGYLVYFFELACAVSGYTLGINPFDQPGVEAYKNNMFALLGKKGEKFDEIRSKLNK
ncbi:MAG: glucose-6-phosphate isomerase [Clostridia bacterium]|nr:glucose-6-phosphate isomerase [Clostridia bacterium]